MKVQNISIFRLILCTSHFNSLKVIQNYWFKIAWTCDNLLLRNFFYSSEFNYNIWENRSQSSNQNFYRLNSNVLILINLCFYYYIYIFNNYFCYTELFAAQESNSGLLSNVILSLLEKQITLANKVWSVANIINKSILPYQMTELQILYIVWLRELCFFSIWNRS